MKPLTSFIRRKYYLNRKVKGFCKVSSRRRVISITEAEMYSASDQNALYFNDLVNIYKYRIQFTMSV